MLQSSEKNPSLLSIVVIKDIEELNELKDLLEKALVENKWVIHFGL